MYGIPEYRANFEKIVFFDNDDRNFETDKRTDFPATGVEALLNKFDYTTVNIKVVLIATKKFTSPHQYKTDKLRPQKIDDELLIAAATPITQLYNEEEDL